MPGTALSVVLGYSPLDLILLDLMFPNGFSGYDIFKELRKLPQLDDVPIVMISAADAEIEMRKARQVGLDSYIAKPIDSEQFSQQLKAIMDGEAVWTVSESA